MPLQLVQKPPANLPEVRLLQQDGASARFRSAEEELLARSLEKTPRRSSVGRGMDELISDRYPEFARAGYLCIAIDALGFGSRTLPAEEDFSAFDSKRRNLDAGEAERWSLELYRGQAGQCARALGTVGLSMAAVVATDDLRTVDYLTTRDDVDPGRIGCMGLSFGSFRCNYLAALDERVCTAVSACWISTFDGIIDYNIRDSMGFFAIPGDLYREFDMVDIPIAAAPKPFLALSGWSDPLMEPRGAARAHLALRDAWEKAGHKDALGSMVLDASHEFNAEMQQIAREFLHLHLVQSPNPS